MRVSVSIIVVLLIAISSALSQSVDRELKLSAGQTVEVVNRYGRVDIIAQEITTAAAEGDKAADGLGTLSVISKGELSESEITIIGTKGNLRIEVSPDSLSKRVDLKLSLPERSKLIVETKDGGILVEGNFASVNATTDTGTIAVDVPTENLKYDLNWTMSKPRYLADFEIEEVQERSGGRFQIKGVVGHETKKKKKKSDKDTPAVPDEPKPTIFTERIGDGESDKTGTERKEAEKLEVEKRSLDKNDAKANEKKAEAEMKAKTVALLFTTARGIVLLNVPPNEVMSDLRERPLTNAAKAIVRSGDSMLLDAIRRASPKYFGDYTKTLPPARLSPQLIAKTRPEDVSANNVKVATTRVLDERNRAIAGLTAEDFEVVEGGERREVISAKPVTAPFNLVLLLDVSGSVDNYVNFIRKAARAFVNTVDPQDRVSIVLFNEDVKVLANFTTDREKLSNSLDTFDAGGPTAFYDAIGYTLTETLHPLKGDRTAIVILSDGDDNRSFLPFDSLAGSIEESGALIYPLYVPSSLAAVGASQDLNAAVDPLRAKYLNTSLTSKADSEGAKLAQLSGGTYYPITQLSQIQKAYEDIVLQLRTGYDVMFRSTVSTPDGRPSPRLKIRSKRPNTYTQISRVQQWTDRTK
jgi:VWFA-related protein